MTYIKQFDSIRAIAVALVIITHWGNNIRLVHYFPLSGFGVNTFFVLSGFLITYILLINHSKIEQGVFSRKKVLINFYIRRSLRIFPIYFLTLGLLYIFQEPLQLKLKDSIVYYLTYTTNLYFFSIGDWADSLSHLWTLAVEEQFYIIWPFVILFTKKDYLIYAILVFICVGLGSQVALRNHPFGEFFTSSCFDAFGFGGLFAWVLRLKSQFLNKFSQIISVLCIIVCITFLLGMAFPQLKVYFDFLPIRFKQSIVSLYCIAMVFKQKNNNAFWANKLLNIRPIIYLGKISYGLYLYHNFIPKFSILFINYFINPLFPNSLELHLGSISRFILNIILLIGFSIFSYEYIEKSFLKIKDKYVLRDIKKPIL